MINALGVTLDELKTQLTEKQERLNFLNNQFTDFYHGLEIMELNHVSTSHKFLKSFQKCLKERRSLKADIMRLHVVIVKEEKFRENHNMLLTQAEAGLKKIIDLEGLDNIVYKVDKK